jgi:hypothetical protein
MTSKAVFTIEKRRKLAFLTADHTCRKNRNGEQAAAGYMGRLQGESGRAEDPSLPTAGRKGLAEAGPPGKRPHGNESGRLQKRKRIMKFNIYRCFIFKTACRIDFYYKIPLF